MASQGASVAIQLTSTIVLARLLGPEEYGVIAMVMAVTGFAGLFRDLGLSSSTIQREKLSHEQLSTLYWINVGMGAVLTAIVAAAAPLVAWFYGRPELTAVTIVLSLNFLVGSFGTQPGALLTRQMRFGRIAAANLSGAVLGLIVAVAMASQGYGYWSLVIGGIAGSALTTALLIILLGWRPGFAVRGSGVRSMLIYGANITAFDLVSYFHRNLDNILIGRFWGVDALGLYSRAYALLMFPISNLRGPINAVAFPAMSRLQNDPDSLRSYYLRVTSVIAFVSMPVTAFFYVASAPLIEVLLGHKWMAVSPIFAYLAIAGFVQPAAGLVGTLLLSIGQSKRYLQFGVFNAFMLTTSFVVGLPWGPTGVALGYAVANYIVLYPSMWWALRESPVSVVDFARACAPPAVASFLAVVVATTVNSGLASLPPLVELLALMLVFGVALLPLFLFTKVGRTHASMLIDLMVSRRRRYHDNA